MNYRAPSELNPSPIKLRKASKRQIEHLVECLRRWGVVIPVLIDATDQIIAGHGIWEAAKELALEVIPTVTLDHLSHAEARALRIAINKIQELSTWNESVLKDELTFLAEFDFETLSYTCFSSAELDPILHGPANKPDDALLSLATTAISRLGDIWVFEGGHRLGCFDALDAGSYAAVMAGSLASLSIVDPPYNVRIQGHVTRRAGTREFAMASGEKPSDEFIVFLRTYLDHLRANCRDGALLLQWMDWRHMGEMLAAGREAELSLQNLIVWSKSNPGMGSLWRSAHELCFAWKSGNAPHCNQVQLGRNGRNRSNVWEYPGANAFSSREDREGLEHVTAKNVAMIQDAILDVSRPGDIVLDCFAGSGTTLLAAHRARRIGYGIELDPLYVDLSVRRLEARTKSLARHAESGLTFGEIAAEREVAPRLRLRNR